MERYPSWTAAASVLGQGSGCAGESILMRAALFLLLCSLCAAAEVKQCDLNRMAAYWQHVLKLDDWDVAVKFVKVSELPENTAGYSQRYPESQYIVIAVPFPSEYAAMAARNEGAPKTGREITADIEDTIIHELVHLRVREMGILGKAGALSVATTDKERKDYADTAGATEELTVNRITSALLAARSSARRHTP